MSSSSPDRFDEGVFFGDEDRDPRRGDVDRPFGEFESEETDDRLEHDEFFERPAPPTLGGRARLSMLARDPMRFGAILLGLGFWAVFVRQANILHQIVLVAPIFEEFFKFGLALVLVAALRLGPWPLRLLVAAAVGAGFGVLEHVVSYAETDTSFVYAARVGFHSGATALSMITYHALEPMGDVRVRWGSTVLSTFVHYVNNVGALVIGVASLANDQAAAPAMGLLAATASATWGLALLMLVAGRPLRRLLRRRFPEPGAVRLGPAR